MQNQDRRASGVKRVPVQTLVEICGRVPEVPAFEAQSIEVSGRGMHVRTRYLPPVGAPLVLRFEERGRQILVEGEVAWADETDHGGEFGIRFTALDSGSVDALKDLCRIPAEVTAAAADADADPADDEDAASDAPGAAKQTRKPNGTRVRLHIEGLGAPMKAQVRRSGGRQMTVGSKLEFLKLGRHLDIEDLEAGDRLGAAIETVDVIIDPQSQIPQLVVSLAYDQPLEDATPEPSVVNARKAHSPEARPAEFADDEGDEDLGPPTRVAGTPNQASSRAALSHDEDEFDDDPDFDSDADYEDGVSAEYDDERGPSALQAKLGGAAASAGRIAKNTGEALKHVGLGAATRVGGWLSRSRKRQTSAPREQGAPPTRKQSVRGSGITGGGHAESRRLRPQSLRGTKAAAAGAPSRRAPEDDAPKRRNLKRYGAAAGAVVLLSTVAVMAMRTPAEVPGEAELSKPVAAEEIKLGPTDDVTSVDEEGNPIAASASPTPDAPDPGGKTTADGISADVPLFGPTPMATSEAAPVDEPAEEALDEAVDDTPPVEDETWEDGKSAEGKADKPVAAAKPAVVDPSKVKPWGRGRVVRPTIHRIRLDGPGGAIQGAINPTGFTVVIPGRKVMESGAAITKRDKRLARVKTGNAGGGAQVSFQFKDGIPGYRVRLRKDFVEFLISEPQKGGALAKQ